MQSHHKVLFIVIILFLSSSKIFAQNKNESFYSNYLKANFFDKDFTAIKSYSFESYEQGNMGIIIKSSDSIKVYVQKPNYSRTEYISSKRTYCYNGTELLKVSAATNFKPQTVSFAVNLASQQATLSMFLNGFVSRNSIMSTNLIEKFEIVSDSLILDSNRYFKITQKLNEEIDFEYVIDYKTLLLFREITIKNGAITTQIEYSDYHKVDGIYFPFRKIEKSFISGLNLERVVLKFILNPTLPKKIFDCL